VKNFIKRNVIGIICLVSLAVCILFSSNISHANIRDTSTKQAVDALNETSHSFSSFCDFLDTSTKQAVDALNETKAFPYYLVDVTRDNKFIGILSTYERIQLGQIILLEDDVYRVENIKLFCQKNKNKLKLHGVDECHIYNAQYYEVRVSFVGKAK
jgi:hypothetical protein